MYDIIGLLRSILILLQEPNPDSPANTVAAKLFQENFQEYKNRVRQCVEESWIISDSFEYEKYSKEIID
jgi:ubiquitin-conjugating enzyme E2 A